MVLFQHFGFKSHPMNPMLQRIPSPTSSFATAILACFTHSVSWAAAQNTAGRVGAHSSPVYSLAIIRAAPQISERLEHLIIV